MTLCANVSKAVATARLEPSELMVGGSILCECKTTLVKICKDVFASPHSYPLSYYWFFTYICVQTGFQWLELGSQVGLTIDHF